MSGLEQGSVEYQHHESILLKIINSDTIYFTQGGMVQGQNVDGIPFDNIDFDVIKLYGLKNDLRSLGLPIPAQSHIIISD